MLSPNTTHAERFLDALGGLDNKFLFVAIPDKKGTNQAPQHIYGAFAETRHKLEQLNGRGYGIFVTVNETRGDRRQKQDIVGVRALFVDDDTGKANVAAFLKPHITVQSSPGKHHYYWLTYGITVDEFTELSPALVKMTGGDENAKDLARVLRLPGFYHLKSSPVMVELLNVGDHPPYAHDDLYPLLTPYMEFPQAADSSGSFSPAEMEEARAALTFINPDETYGVWLSIGMALKTAFGDEGLPLWEEWSAGGGKYKDGECAAKWDGFKRSKGKMATLGTLFYHAKKEGYKPKATDKTDKIPLNWPELGNLPPLCPPTVSLRAEDMPPVLRDWCIDRAERFQVPVEMIAVLIVGVLSSLAARNFTIMPLALGEWVVFLNLWALLVAPPSSKKSLLLKEATDLIEPYERQAFAKAQEKAHLIAAEVRIAAARAKGIERLIQSKKGEKLSQEELTKLTEDLAKLDEQSNRKVTTLRYMVSDATVEKLQEIIRDNPKGLLLARDELSGWFDDFTKHGRESDRSFYLKCWDGNGSHPVDRIGRGSFPLNNLMLSIVGTIQPGRLKKHIRMAIEGGEGADGLIQRFQLTVLTEIGEHWEKVDREPNRQANEAMSRIVDKLATLNLEERRALQFTKEAQALFDEWHAQIEREARSREIRTKEAYQGHLGKYGKMVPAIAAIFESISIENPATLEKVGVECLTMAIRWWEVMQSHARKLYAPEFYTGVEEAHKLAKKIAQGSIFNGMPVREIMRSGWEGLKKTDGVEMGLHLLEKAGFVQVVTHREGPGRPSKILYIRPGLNLEEMGFVSFGS